MNATRRLLRAVRRRERLADAARTLARWGLPAGLLIAAVTLLAIRRLGAPPVLLWLTATPVPALLGWALARKRSWRATARRVDDHYGLDDRIGNALELERDADRRADADPRTARIVELLAAEAEATAAGLDPRPVVPLRVPGPRPLDGLALAALVLAALVPDPVAPHSEGPSDAVALEVEDAQSRASGVDLAMAEPVRQDLRALAEGEDELATIAQQMLEVLEALEAGEIDRAEAFERLEQLEEELASAEERFEATLEEDPAMLAEALRELAEALEQHDVMAEAGLALRREDPDAVEKAFDEAAERAAEAGAQEQQALQEALDEAERRLSKAAQQQRDTAKEMDEEERRLRKEEKKEPQSQAEKEEQERRLDRMKRRLEELRRRHEREMAAQRRLEQLRRDAESAAKSATQRGDSGQDRKRSLERLGRNTGEATRTAQRSRRMGQARDSLEEAKNIIRRAGKQDESSKRRQEQFRRFSDAAKGKRGQQGKDGKDGKDGKGKSTLLVEGNVGEGEPDMMMEMPGDQGQGQGQEGQGQEGQGDGDGQGQGQGQGQDGRDGGSRAMAGGDGIGEGSAAPLQDDPTRIGVRPHDVHVNAKHGRGVSRAQVIRDSSQQGFATEPYRRVFEDYHNFAQSALDSEDLPPSRRRAIKRYYQIISPRD
jgi:hypothetical protein